MVITHSIFDNMFLEDGLCRLKCPILNFDGSPIDSIQGYFRTMAHFNGHNCPVSIYVADDDCEPVIGHDHLMHLGIIVDFSLQSMHRTKSSAGTCAQSKEQTECNALPNAQASTRMANLQSNSSDAPMSEAQKCNLHVQPLAPKPTPKSIPSSISNVVKQHPNPVSKDISTYPDNQHRIQLSADAKPVAVKMRPIPHTIRFVRELLMPFTCSMIRGFGNQPRKGIGHTF